MVPLLQQSASAAATRARRSCSARAAAAGAQPPQEPGPSQPIGSSQPALMRRAQAADEPDAARQPWNVVTYITKKKTRKWDSTGNFVGQDDPEMLHAPAGWTADRQLQFAVSVTARDAGLSEEALWERCGQLATLIPDLAAERRALPGDIARLALDLEGTTRGLLALRAALPSVNVSLVAARAPALLRLPAEALRARAAEAREVLALPAAGASEAADDEFCRLLEAAPLVLDLSALRRCVADLRRLVPDGAPARMLAADPSLLLAAQDLRSQALDDRDLTDDPVALGYTVTGLVEGD